MIKGKNRKQMTNNDLQNKQYTENERPSNANPTKIRGWTQALPRGKKFPLY